MTQTARRLKLTVVFAYLIIGAGIACSKDRAETPTPGPSAAPSPSVGPTAKGETDLIVAGDLESPTCTVTDADIKCNGQKCGNNAQIWWNVKNEIDNQVEVIVMKFRHEATGFYIDPLTGPGNASIHKVAVAPGSLATPSTATLKTKVKKQDGAGFGGAYTYGVGLRFTVDEEWGPWMTCIDPKVHIQD